MSLPFTSACAAALFLALCGAARADVFVPSDPPPLPGARCAAGAGDVLAAGVEYSDLRVSLGGGAWTAVDGLAGCPVLAAAVDGSAALAGESAETGDELLRVRVPGGGFGPPIVLGHASQPPAVAVAPGGWAAAAWVEDPRTLVAVVVRPGGTTARASLDRGTLEDRDPAFLGAQRVGIDSTGRTTVIWQRWERSKVRVRVARGTAGGAPVTMPDLSVGPAVDTRAAEPSLAVAPSGTEVVAWSTLDGVSVTVDGQTPQQFPGADARPVTAVADGGTVVVAYTTSLNEVVTVERAAGTWSSPRVIAVFPRRSGGGYRDEPDLSVVGAAVGPDRRAAALWSRVDDSLAQRVYGALGRVGGSWSGPQALSSVTRSAAPAGLWLDAAGAPRALWTEDGLGVRGAGVADRPADTSPPVVSARFARSVPPTRSGRFTARVRVRCSEACDARLAVAGEDSAYENIVRSLRAGQERELRLRASGGLAEELRRDPKARRIRLRLVVTDRAGNIVRRSGTLRVRVIEKPIRALKVAPDHDFHMKTAEGNRLVVRLVNDLIEAAATRRPSENALNRRFNRGSTAIRRAGHREIASSRVYSEIYAVLVVPLTRAGYDTDEVLATR